MWACTRRAGTRTFSASRSSNMAAVHAAAIAATVTSLLLLRRRWRGSGQGCGGGADAVAGTDSVSSPARWWQGSLSSGMVELVPPADSAEAPPCDTAAPKVAAAEVVYVDGQAQLAGCRKALMRPRQRWPHLTPFLLPTRCVDSDHAAVKRWAMCMPPLWRSAPLLQH